MTFFEFYGIFLPGKKKSPTAKDGLEGINKESVNTYWRIYYTRFPYHFQYLSESVTEGSYFKTPVLFILNSHKEGRLVGKDFI